MLFNTFDFWIFFACVLLISTLSPHRLMLYFLLGASYFFYGYWRWEYTGLLLLSTLIDYFAARAMPGARTPRRKKLLLIVSLVSNLTLLGVFKYYNFFASSLSTWFGFTAIPLNVLLPVGISFYTFQSMSYTIDVYRGILQPRSRFVEFALFVAFFPQLVAGPIIRAVNFLPQLDQKPRMDLTRVRSGLHLIVRGLIEKVVIADNLASVVEKVFADPGNFNGGDMWIATYCFAFQIFCDFAGYTDIARGCARIMGFDFLENFRRPYAAEGISDFWRRWHISLSTWLRDYLYIPLGGSRHGEISTYRNLMLTMVLGGLWHGANWTFVLWGSYHGALLCLNHAYRYWLRKRDSQGVLGSSFVARGIRIFVTFHLVCIGWVLFRAPNLSAAASMLNAMLSPPIAFGSALIPYAILCAALLVAMLAHEFLNPGKYFEKLPLPARGLVLFACYLLLVAFAPVRRVAFIYFQF